MAVYKLAVADVVEFPVRLAYTDGGQPNSAAFRLHGQRMSGPELRDLRSREGQTQQTDVTGLACSVTRCHALGDHPGHRSQSSIG